VITHAQGTLYCTQHTGGMMSHRKPHRQATNKGSRLSRRVARSQNLTKERLGEDKELGIPKMRSQLSSSKHLGINANACKCQHGSNMPTKSSTHSKGSTFPVDVATHEMI